MLSRAAMSSKVELCNAGDVAVGGVMRIRAGSPNFYDGGNVAEFERLRERVGVAKELLRKAEGVVNVENKLRLVEWS